jgi:hypothetical protein
VSDNGPQYIWDFEHPTTNSKMESAVKTAKQCLARRLAKRLPRNSMDAKTDQYILYMHGTVRNELSKQLTFLS